MSEVLEQSEVTEVTPEVTTEVTPVTPTESKPTESAPVLSDSEQRAMEHGWRPKEEFQGDVSKWVSADEFLRRGELFDKIDVMGRDLRETKKALKMLQAHHEQLRETEIKAAMQSLKAEKKQAYEEGDHDKLVEIDDQLLNFREIQRQEKVAQQQQASQPDPRFVQWVGQNPWYTSDQELRSFGDDIGVSYARQNPEKDPDEVLRYVESRVRKAFPEKFTNPNRAKPSAVANGSTPASSKKDDDFQLNDEERRAMNTFVRQGILTKEQYIADLKKMRA
jgi:hypothetical protein